MMRKSLLIITILIFVFSFAAASFAQNGTAAHIKFYYRFLQDPIVKTGDTRNIGEDKFAFEMYPKFQYQKGDNTLFWELQINASAGNLFTLNNDGGTNLWQVKWFVYPKMFNGMVGFEAGRDEALSKGIDNFGFSTYKSPIAYPFVKIGDSMEAGIIFTFVNWGSYSGARSMMFQPRFVGVVGPLNLEIRVPFGFAFNNRINNKDNLDMRIQFQAKGSIDLGIVDITAMLAFGFRSSKYYQLDTTVTPNKAIDVTGIGFGVDLLAKLKIVPGITPMLRISFLSGGKKDDAAKDNRAWFVFGEPNQDGTNKAAGVNADDNSYMWDWTDKIVMSGEGGNSSIFRNWLNRYGMWTGFLKIGIAVEISAIPDLIVKPYGEFVIIPTNMTDAGSFPPGWGVALPATVKATDSIFPMINFGLFAKYSGFGNGCWMEMLFDFTYFTDNTFVQPFAGWMGGNFDKAGIGILIKLTLMNDF